MNTARAERRQLAMGLALLLALLVGYTWAVQAYFTGPVPGGNDFFSRYVAWRAWILEGRNPYSDEVTTEIQVKMNGRPARPGEDENALIYPWYAILVQWPFLWMPWSWARAAYIVASQAYIVAGLALTARLLRWRLSPGMLAWTAVWAAMFYPEGRAIILGQIVVTQYVLAVLALWLIHRRQDAWAGVALALTTVRPTPIFLFVPCLLIWAALRRRWQIIVGCGLALAVLFVAGFLFLPTWLTDWLYRVSRYPAYTVGQSPVWLLVHQVFHFDDRWTWALSALCVAGLLAAWVWALRQPDEAAFHWALGLTFVVSDLIVPRSATTNYIFLLLPTYLIFAALSRTWRRAGPWLIVAIQIVGLVGLWWLFAATVQGDQEQAIMYIPQPVLIGAVLLVGRAWLVRDQRAAGATA